MPTGDTGERRWASGISLSDRFVISLGVSRPLTLKIPTYNEFSSDTNPLPLTFRADPPPAAAASQSGNAGVACSGSGTDSSSSSWLLDRDVGEPPGASGAHAGMPPSRLDRRLRRLEPSDPAAAFLSAGAQEGIPPASPGLLPSGLSSVLALSCSADGESPPCWCCGAQAGGPPEKLGRRPRDEEEDASVVAVDFGAHGGKPCSRLGRRTLLAAAPGVPFPFVEVLLGLIQHTCSSVSRGERLKTCAGGDGAGVYS